MNFGVENRFRFKQELRCLECQKKTDWILAQEKRREGYTFFPLSLVIFRLALHFVLPLSYYLNSLECYFKLTFSFNWRFLVSSVYRPLEEVAVTSKSFLGVEETRNAQNRRENA